MVRHHVRKLIGLACGSAALAVLPHVAVADAPAAAAPATAASALTLAQTLQDVAAANPSLQAKRAMATAASRRASTAGAWEHPMLEMGAVNVPTSGGFDDDEMTMKMVGVAQRVPLFGANGLRRRAAAEEATAERATATREHYAIYGQAIEAYAAAYFGLERAHAAARHQGIMDRLVASARARYQSGSGRLEDALRAEAERARGRADEVSFAATAARALARLDALRGQEPGPSGAPDAGQRSLEAPPPFAVPADPSLWRSAALDHHPRILEAEARARRYKFSARAARRERWPDMEIRGSYGIRGKDRMGMSLDDMISASVGFTVPVFAGSRENAMGAEMDAMARAAAAERREAELDLAREAAALHAEARAASRMISLLADTVLVVQRRALESSWNGYVAGANDLQRVFELGHSLYMEDLELLDAKERHATAQGGLVALTGRGDLAGLELPAIRKEER